MKLMARHIKPTGRSHSASVIFLHGSGDTGCNLVEWIRFLLGRDLEFDHIKIIYPTAPLQPYTPMSGALSHVWFDRRSISIDASENRKSMIQIYETVQEIIAEESRQGIPPNRIVVGGFSMGGALAMHAGYYLNTDLCGVFACSSFLNHDSAVYESLREHARPGAHMPELRMFHGDRDTLVPLNWGQQTFDMLKKFDVKGTFTPLSNTLHELKKQELIDIQEWILNKLPPLNSEQTKEQ